MLETSLNLVHKEVKYQPPHLLHLELKRNLHELETWFTLPHFKQPLISFNRATFSWLVLYFIHLWMPISGPEGFKHNVQDLDGLEDLSVLTTGSAEIANEWTSGFFSPF